MADGTQDGGTFVTPEATKLKVFISYSRDDLDFADQLAAALQIAGFDPTIDRQGISGGEAWQQRLGNLILEADTVVFVLSPSSARSEVCAWEVEEAAKHSKRILPVLARPLGDAQPPARLQDLNYMFFYHEPKSPGSGFGVGLSRLVAALNTDLGWIREHTRLLERATEWDAGKRAASRLLSGTDIVQAKAWAARRPKGAPEPTPMHVEFIRASEQEEAGRATVERKRLDEMAAAQAERAKALAAAEEAVRNAAEALRARNRARTIITWGAMVFAVIVTALGIAAGIQWRIAVAERTKGYEELLYDAQVARSTRAHRSCPAAHQQRRQQNGCTPDHRSVGRRQRSLATGFSTFPKPMMF